MTSAHDNDRGGVEMRFCRREPRKNEKNNSVARRLLPNSSSTKSPVKMRMSKKSQRSPNDDGGKIVTGREYQFHRGPDRQLPPIMRPHLAETALSRRPRSNSVATMAAARTKRAFMRKYEREQQCEQQSNPADAADARSEQRRASARIARAPSTFRSGNRTPADRGKRSRNMRSRK